MWNNITNGRNTVVKPEKKFLNDGDILFNRQDNLVEAANGHGSLGEAASAWMHLLWTNWWYLLPFQFTNEWYNPVNGGKSSFVKHT